MQNSLFINSGGILECVYTMHKTILHLSSCIGMRTLSIHVCVCMCVCVCVCVCVCDSLSVSI